MLRNSVTGYLSERKPGFEKDRGSPVERHVIRWDIDRVARQASVYRLIDLFPTSQNNYFESFETFAPETSSATKEFPWDMGHYHVSITFQKVGRLAWRFCSNKEGAPGPECPAA